MTPRAVLRQIIRQVAIEQHLDPEAVERADSRRKGVAHARATVAARLFERRVPVIQIARLMKITRARVLEYIREVQQEETSHDDDQSTGTEGSSPARTARSACQR